ncbi:MAG: CPBP family intramembrane metalloprotease [Lachnospiraceae bacterium]|nr:CPBP family intramembrane metalloprotease [Oscillospiraceae bacterium]MBQ6321297.1 CPBP family intramembrane metalloprotease [Lachnospiraceae bacterium]
MHDTEFNRTQTVKFLVWTFALAYLIQFGASFLFKSGNAGIGQMIIAAVMFVPTLGVLLSGAPLKNMGWKPQIRKNIGPFLTAWFAPLILTAAGACLYFLLFPSHLDLSGKYLAEAAGAEALNQLEAQGLTYPLYILISAVSSMVYAPFLNMFLALGEEIGWRGFLYPQLKARFGTGIGRLLGGIVWGAWHWPLIWLIGYEYGAASGNPAGYFGFPVTGMLLFCVITAGWGVLHDWLYEKSGSIWVPSLFHGAINAAAALPLTVCLTNTGSARLLGPVPNGLIAGLPFLTAAAVLTLRRKKTE